MCSRASTKKYYCYFFICGDLGNEKSVLKFETSQCKKYLFTAMYFKHLENRGKEEMEQKQLSHSIS